MRIRELTNRTKLLLTASAVGALALGGILPAAASSVDGEEASVTVTTEDEARADGQARSTDDGTTRSAEAQADSDGVDDPTVDVDLSRTDPDDGDDAPILDVGDILGGDDDRGSEDSILDLGNDDDRSGDSILGL